MIAVIFEVWPKPEHRERYLDEAAAMREAVQTIDGFVSVERFESLTEPGKILSLSVFEDESALDAWRRMPAHRRAQALGRSEYFRDYRLRVTRVLRDYGLDDRAQAPADSRDAHG